MSENLGSGVFLDERFDFSVDPTGDLKSTSGLNELQKDLAFQMVINLEQFIGQPPTGNLQEKVAGTAKRVAEADSRVRYVLEGDTEVIFSDDREEITLKMTAQTRDEQQNLIFDI